MGEKVQYISVYLVRRFKSFLKHNVLFVIGKVDAMK